MIATVFPPLRRLSLGDVAWAVFWGGVSLGAMTWWGPRPAGLFLGVATIVLLAFRRVCPRVSAVGLLAVLAGQAVTHTETLTAATIIVALALAYDARRHVPTRWRMGIPVALVVGIVGYVLVGPTMTDTPLLTRLPALGWGLGSVAIAALVGEVRRRSAEERTREVEHLRVQMNLQREEYELRAMEQRTFIAREVHDIVAHTLATIVAQADGARYSAEHDPRAAQEALATIARVGRTSLRQMRGVVSVLRDGESRSPAPADGVDTLPRLLEEVTASGLRVRYDTDGTPPPHLPQDVSLAVYRIVQESLTNVRRHSRADHADVAIRWAPEAVTVTVDDPGEAVPGGPAGHGLAGLAERVAIVGGEFTAAPHGDGWRVRAVVPCEEGWWSA